MRARAARKIGPSRGGLHASLREELFVGRDPFNLNSNRSDRENWCTSKGGPVFSKLFRLDRTDPLSLVEWIAPCTQSAKQRSAYLKFVKENKSLTVERGRDDDLFLDQCPKYFFQLPEVNNYIKLS